MVKVLLSTGNAPCVSDTSTIYRKLSRCNVEWRDRRNMHTTITPLTSSRCSVLHRDDPGVTAERAVNVDIPGRARLDAREPQLVDRVLLQIERDVVDRQRGKNAGGNDRGRGGVAAPATARLGPTETTWTDTPRASLNGTTCVSACAAPAPVNRTAGAAAAAMAAPSTAVTDFLRGWMVFMMCSLRGGRGPGWAALTGRSSDAHRDLHFFERFSDELIGQLRPRRSRRLRGTR